jgi:hypothetical protein
MHKRINIFLINALIFLHLNPLERQINSLPVKPRLVAVVHKLYERIVIDFFRLSVV